jgi:hypothetical protein
MTRRRHLGTHINYDRVKRFKKNHARSAQIRAMEDALSQTNRHTISVAEFEDYIQIRREARMLLGPLYEDEVFQRMR